MAGDADDQGAEEEWGDDDADEAEEDGAEDLQVCGEAENGENAVARVKELIPDLVILDLQMPVMNGLDAARRIAQIAPQLPMLMFTMYSSEYLVTEARAAGIKDVFSKSTGIPDGLISAIQEILGSENGSENASRTPAKRSESDA